MKLAEYGVRRTYRVRVQDCSHRSRRIVYVICGGKHHAVLYTRGSMAAGWVEDDGGGTFGETSLVYSCSYRIPAEVSSTAVGCSRLLVLVLRVCLGNDLLRYNTPNTLGSRTWRPKTSLSYTESLPNVPDYIAAIPARAPRLSFDRTVVATLARLGASSRERVSPLVVFRPQIEH